MKISHCALGSFSSHYWKHLKIEKHKLSKLLTSCVKIKSISEILVFLFSFRQISGAMIRISNCEDRDAPANLDRTITISGNAESVALAQYLINMRLVCCLLEYLFFLLFTFVCSPRPLKHSFK